MAEILIKSTDATNADPAKDALCYKRGDPVLVMDDGHLWSPGELDLRVFYIIKLPGVPASALQKYLEPEYDDPASLGLMREPQIIRRRRWHGNGTPLEWQEQLARDGFLAKPWDELSPYVKDKRTGQTEAGKPLPPT